MMTFAKYTNDSQPFSDQEIQTLQHQIKEKHIDSWHELMGNIVQHADNSNYRALVKDTCKLLFKESREDEAMYIIDHEKEYGIVFSKITTTLEKFFDDDVEFMAILAHVYRDARFGYHDFKKTITYATRAADQNNSLGMAILAYQYFYGHLTIEQDKEKAFDFADKAMLNGSIHGSFCKAFLFFQERNYEVSESIVNAIEGYEDSDFASAIYTLKADLALEQQNTENALSYLQAAIDYNQSSHPYFMLGRQYLYGTDTIPADVEKGLYYLEKAFQKGAAHAGLFIGYYYAYNAPDKDIQKGQDYLAKAATYNNPNAKYELARLYIFHEQFDLSQKLEAIAILEDIKKEHYSSYIELSYQYLVGDIVEKNTTKGLQYLEEVVSKGYGYAAFYLGREYQNGTFNEANEYAPQYDKALHWYKTGSDMDSIEAIEMAGQYYRMGVGTEPDAQKALEYIQKGIQHFNSNFSKVELAICHESGFGVEENYQKAFDLYLSTAENQYPYGHYKVGLYYRDGILSDNQPDFDKSFHHFSIAADTGYDFANYELAKATYYGEGTNADIPKAVTMYKKNLEQNIYDAAIDLALYHEEEGENYNPQIAFEYLKKAAEEGRIPFGIHKLGIYYYNGFGVEENKDEAKKYFKLAIDYNYPFANISLGNLEFWEEASDSSETNAFQYYDRAAEYGYYNYGLGMCYKYGIGTSKDIDKAFGALKKGSEAEYSLATYHLGMCYLEGEGTTKEENLAFQHFSSIADYDRYAKYQLAHMYIEGKGTDKNLSLGVQYLTDLGKDGYTEAQYDLGNLYLVGNGVEESNDIAFEWFTKAAENGHKGAMRIVNPSKSRRK